MTYIRLQTFNDYVCLQPESNYNVIQGLEEAILVRNEGQYYPGRTYYRVLDPKGYPLPYEAFFDESQTGFFFHLSPISTYSDIGLLLS